ncbi:MAG: di-heme oxidoredictase family protein [Verrucomicrobiales bacterium]|nr:di-heme oxidoredictase family protein [Verrucomicrobiales bacterium]
MSFPIFARSTGAALALATVLLPSPTAAETADPYATIGDRLNASIVDGVAVTEGTIRVRRRHENDMDFGKYNPFYWEGRHAWFKVEDYTPRGEKRIVFTLHTEWPQDYNTLRGSDLSAIYIGDPLGDETGRSKFALNTRMEHVAGFTHFEKELGETAFHQHQNELKKGGLLTFEFRFFNSETHPGWAKQKKHNPHNLFAYYSEFFRIKIGQPGLHIDNFQNPDALPSPKRYAGGWTTAPTTRVEPWNALQQQAFNIEPGNAHAFLSGRTWFHTDMVSGKHLSDPSDDKPSLFFDDMRARRKGFAGSAYNTRSCITCHSHNGGAKLPPPGAPVHTTVLRLTGPKSPHGVQLQTDGDDSEGTVTIARYETHEVKLADGTVVELSKPVFHIDGKPATAISPRTPPAIVGAGLLDAVPENTILELAKNSTGEPRRVGGTIGRFGWKADQPTVDQQNRSALLQDMGVEKLAPEGLNELNAYVSLLGVPPRTNPDAPAVLAGENIFFALNCSQCHTPSLRTGESMFAEVSNQTIHPFTDLLLHDMGQGLSDNGDGPLASKWRTAPLWALKNKRHAIDDHAKRFRSGDTSATYADTRAAADENPLQLLHDGRARSLAEAILWHAGEAEASVTAYKKLSAAERSALEAYLWDL